MIKKSQILMKSLLISLLLISLAVITGCSNNKKIINTANLNLDIGIGISHFENDSDYPAPDSDAYIDIYSSKIVIRGAYDDKIIETPLIYNNSSTAHPRTKLFIFGNKMLIAYCPDISVPTLQIASTSNGGEDWLQSKLELDPSDIASIGSFTATFWSAKDGALIIADGSVDTHIYKTTDGGKSWKKSDCPIPTQNWHVSVYGGAFLNENIGLISYTFYDYPPNEPTVYLTVNGGKKWKKLNIKVPSSVMEAYALAGTAFYSDGKINIPIELYDADMNLLNTVYYVSYDLAESWEFFVPGEAAELEAIRQNGINTWFQKNRPAALANKSHTIFEFSEYSTFNIEENVRIDAYKLIANYQINDWSDVILTKEMYFDKEMNLYYKDSEGWPILLFVYEGDVFEHSYYLLGSCPESQYKSEGEKHLAKRLFEDIKQQMELKQLFADACEAYSWFTGYTSPILGEESDTYNDEVYDVVNIEGIESTTALYEYLLTLFYDTSAQKIFNTYVNDTQIPLFIDLNDRLYRYGGYVGQYVYSTVSPEVTVTELSSSKAELRITINSVIDEKAISISYTCNCYVGNDGNWRISDFILPIEYLHRYERGEIVTDDYIEREITDIADWDRLNYHELKSSNIQQFLTALITNDYEKLAVYSSASSPTVFARYAEIRIKSYSIKKTYIGGQPKIIFTYESESTLSDSPRTAAGVHSMYVSVNNSGVYLSDTQAPTYSEAGEYLKQYFTETMAHTLPDFNDLNYQQLHDITQFILLRLGAGTPAVLVDIQTFARECLGISGFNPSLTHKTEDGKYGYIPRNTRILAFDIINETSFRNETTVTVQFYSDASKLIPTATVEYHLTKIGDNYRFDTQIVLKQSSENTYKYTE